MEKRVKSVNEKRNLINIVVCGIVLICAFILTGGLDVKAAEDTDWQKVYDYELTTIDGENCIKLKKYDESKYSALGKEIPTTLTVPAQAIITESGEQKTYRTYLEGNNGNSIWSAGSAVEKLRHLSFEENIKLSVDISLLFSNCSSLTSLDISKLDTSNAKYMGGMFKYCSGLTSLDVSSLNTSGVTMMMDMFSWCSSLTGLDLSNFDTSNVVQMRSMFEGCTNLSSLTLSSKFNTSKVSDMFRMFWYCNSLTSLDLSSFDLSKGPSMGAFLPISSESKLREIKTPRNLSADVELPFTFYDSSYNFYTSLPKNNSSSILLTRGPADASSATVTVPDQTYTGQALKPEVTVKLAGKMIDAANYSVAYLNNTNAGTATATVTFTGNFTGTATGHFRINAAPAAATEQEPPTPPATEQPVTPTQPASPTPAPAKKKEIVLKGKNNAKYVVAGKKLQMQVKVSNPEISIIDIRWKSSNKKWATVNKKGVVKTKKAGRGKKVKITAVITYSVGGDVRLMSIASVDSPELMSAWRSYTTTRSTTIHIPRDTGIKKISISGRTSVRVGSSIQLRARTRPSAKSGRLRWSSSNYSCATVSSSGRVKGVRKGRVVITCRANDGSRARKTKTIRVK